MQFLLSATATALLLMASEAVGTPEMMPKLSGNKLAELMQLSLSEIKERMDFIFGLVDINKDEIVTKEEAQGWSMKLKDAMHKHQVRQEFISIDKDSDGKITLEELEVTYTDGADAANQEAHKEEVRKRFAAVDKDKSTLTDPEKEELTKEFSTYDKNGDGKIDEEELRAVIKDPHAHDLQQMLDSLSNDMPEGKITKQEWQDKFESLAVSMLTDNGEVLRFPEEYEGIDLPFKGIAAGPGEEDKLDHDEL